MCEHSEWFQINGDFLLRVINTSDEPATNIAEAYQIYRTQMSLRPEGQSSWMYTKAVSGQESIFIRQHRQGKEDVQWYKIFTPEWSNHKTDVWREVNRRGTQHNTVATGYLIMVINTYMKVKIKKHINQYVNGNSGITDAFHKNLLRLECDLLQTGFTKGRQTSDATRRLINVIHSVNLTGTPSLLLLLDAEKAFNSVNWNYLTDT